MKSVSIYTDGACRGNPGPGGWAAILVYGQTEKELSGGESLTTNNRMELLAVIRGLSALRERCMVELCTDSTYVANALTLGWLDTWKKENYRRGKKGEIANIDLWERLSELLSEHIVRVTWVRGHNGHPYNERCDKLATAAADSFLPAEPSEKAESSENQN